MDISKGEIDCAKQNQKDRRLLHQQAEPQKQSTREQPSERLSIPLTYQKERAAEHRQDDKMRRVTGETQDRGTHRKNGVTRRRSNSRGRIHQFSTEKKNERHSCGVYQKQAQMNSGDCLSEDRHEQSVGGISPRELHVVSQLVWRNTLQHQLTRISVFSFIPLEWNSEEFYSDRERQGKNAVSLHHARSIFGQ